MDKIEIGKIPEALMKDYINALLIKDENLSFKCLDKVVDKILLELELKESMRYYLICSLTNESLNIALQTLAFKTK